MDLTCHLPRACLMLALEGFPSSSEHEVLAPVNIYTRSNRCSFPWIVPIELEFLDAIVQRFINLLQSAITELVNSCENLMDHSKPRILVSECELPFGESIMCISLLEFKSSGFPSRWSSDLEDLTITDLQIHWYKCLKSLSDEKRIKLESLSLKPPMRNTIHSCNVILAFLKQSRTDQAPVAPIRHQDNMLPSSLRWTKPVCQPCDRSVDTLDLC
ncbi:hypothetical protein Tco_0779737 [Tanacetum coccineum]